MTRSRRRTPSTLTGAGREDAASNKRDETKTAETKASDLEASTGKLTVNIGHWV